MTPFLLFAQQSNSETFTKEIYDNIIMAIGNDSPSPPKFIFNESSKGKVAYIKNKKIYIEKKAVDCLAVLGDQQEDAVAHIIAHELAHHYRGHGWMIRAGYSFSSDSMGTILKERGQDKAQRLVDETDADRFAVFYAHMAGYNTANIADTVLDIIYSSYGLPEEMSGYPTLQERKNIILKKKKELIEFTHIFDAGNLALLTGNYHAAIPCYEYIIDNQFTSFENHNNLGLSYLAKSIEALQIDSSDAFNYYLPLSIITKSNASSEASRSGASFLYDKNSIIEDIKTSIKKFKIASELKEDAIEAKMNMISAKLILKKLNSDYNGINELDIIRDLSNSKYKDCFLGIYYHIIDKSCKAKKYFKQGIKNSDEYSKLNLNFIYSKIKSENNNTKTDLEIIIDDTELSSFSMFNDPIHSFRKIPGLKLKIYQLENSFVYKYGKRLFIQKTTNLDFKTNIGIQASMGKDEVLSLTLGIPTNIIISSKKNYYIYDSINAVFQFENQKLTSLFKYINDDY